MKHQLVGTAIAFGILAGCISNNATAFQTSLPETDVPIAMDNVFKPSTKGIKNKILVLLLPINGIYSILEIKYI